MKIKPINLKLIDETCPTIYEAVIASAKKARILNDNIRQEYNKIVDETILDTGDEFDEKVNPQQEKISVEFEKRPKPHMKALEQLLNRELHYRFKEE